MPIHFSYSTKRFYCKCPYDDGKKMDRYVLACVFDDHNNVVGLKCIKCGAVYEIKEVK